MPTRLYSPQNATKSDPLGVQPARSAPYYTLARIAKLTRATSFLPPPATSFARASAFIPIAAAMLRNPQGASFLGAIYKCRGHVEPYHRGPADIRKAAFELLTESAALWEVRAHQVCIRDKSATRPQHVEDGIQ